MNQAQFVGFMETVFPSYVAERAAADHVSLEMAEQYVRVQLARLLPDGHLTVGHRFLRVLSTDSSQGVGDVWFWIDSENKQAFLYRCSGLRSYWHDRVRARVDDPLIVFTGAVATSSRAPEAARELMKSLKGATAAPVIRAQGMEPTL